MSVVSLVAIYVVEVNLQYLSAIINYLKSQYTIISNLNNHITSLTTFRVTLYTLMHSNTLHKYKQTNKQTENFKYVYQHVSTNVQSQRAWNKKVVRNVYRNVRVSVPRQKHS